MLVTDETFRAFLSCETKSYLRSLGEVGSQYELIEWEQRRLNDFMQKCVAKLRANLGEDEYVVGTSSLQTLENSERRLIVDCVVQAQGFQSHLHALERLTAPAHRKHKAFVPIRFLPKEKVTKDDKLLVAFDALVISTASGEMPLFGKIIHGSEQKVLRVQLTGLMEVVKAVVGKIAAQQASSTPPQLILNKHCPECEFRPRCHQIAIEQDELTLLSRMSQKERQQYHDKGIFSVTQLSYTFRPRRRPKRLASKPRKYSHALKALALREDKIHIAGEPKLNIKGNLVFLDVEGVPDQDFYYLIGLRIKRGESYVQYSFWASERFNEKEILASFLGTLARVSNPQLIYYGSCTLKLLP